MKKASAPGISIVVPVFNEAENAPGLFKEIRSSLERMGRTFEIIFVDDGSEDGTLDELKKLKPLKIIVLRRNFGQSAALDAGIKSSSGRLIITLDGDGQNDPKDFPRLIKKLDEGYDAVCGWRHERKDGLTKRLISRGAALLRNLLVRDNVHDSGCTLRAYRRECFDGLDIRGELHRFIPALVQKRGFRTTEIKVSHRPRTKGKSKYGWKRVIRGFLDMLYVRYRKEEPPAKPPPGGGKSAEYEIGRTIVNH